MAISKRETILARISQSLAGTRLVGSRIYRSRHEPLARGELPALVIEPVNDQSNLQTLGVIEWTFQARIVTLIAGLVPDQLADVILQDIHSKIMTDSTLDGLVINIEPSAVAFDIIEGDQPRGAISTTFTITYRTARESII